MCRTARLSLSLIIFMLPACAFEESLNPAPLPGVASLNVTSGCFAVNARLLGAPSGPWSFAGILTGDLEGTLTIDFDPGSLRFAGVTIKNGGTAHWAITGGVLPAPVTFETAFENKNLAVDRPGSPALVFENIGKHRDVSGVAEANLHYQGSFAVVPALQVDHRYQGVICP
jgi:hypothetical protein